MYFCVCKIGNMTRKYHTKGKIINYFVSYQALISLSLKVYFCLFSSGKTMTFKLHTVSCKRNVFIRTPRLYSFEITTLLCLLIQNWQTRLCADGGGRKSENQFGQIVLILALSLLQSRQEQTKICGAQLLIQMSLQSARFFWTKSIASIFSRCNHRFLQILAGLLVLRTKSPFNFR